MPPAGSQPTATRQGLLFDGVGAGPWLHFPLTSHVSAPTHLLELSPHAAPSGNCVRVKAPVVRSQASAAQGPGSTAEVGSNQPLSPFEEHVPSSMSVTETKAALPAEGEIVQRSEERRVGKEC